MDRLADAAVAAQGSAGTSPARALVDWERPGKRGSNLACLKCRAIKVRCSLANVDDSRCRRCTRLNLACEFKEHRRGRRAKMAKTESSDDGAVASSSLVGLQDEEEEALLPSPRGSPSGRWLGPYMQSILAPEAARKNSTAQRNRASSVHDQNVAPSWNTPPTNRAHALEACDVSVASDLRDNVLRQNMLTLDQAQELFDFYFAHLNPPLAALDSALHTLEYCQRHLPILFSTILAVSARFFRPALYRNCHRVARSVLNLAAVQEICSIDHIQALILVITWKDPADRTTVRKAVRAIGYAYELGLHASFEPTAATHKRDDGLHSRRMERDRQRTWIVLCLIQLLVVKDDKKPRSRARLIALEDHPDPYVWLKAGGDVTTSVDSRLAWSLDACLLMLELDPMLDMIAQSDDPTPFGTFFNRYRSRMDAVRLRYFDVSETGAYMPRFVMDPSAVAELPYLDAHRSFFMCEAIWHWAAQLVSTKQRTDRSTRTYAGSSAEYLTMQSRFCFSQTVEAALRCIRLFLHNLVRPGHLQVGHDYLVITLSQTAKWIFQYREFIDSLSLVSAVNDLEEIMHECAQPQRLPSNEMADTEREAPGYLVRFLQALFDNGLLDVRNRAKSTIEVQHGRWPQGNTPGGFWAEHQAMAPTWTSLPDDALTGHTLGNAVPQLDDKRSLEHLTSSLEAHDLVYWQDLLGSDMLTLV